MDIKLTDSSIRRFLQTTISPAQLAEKMSLCGPTFDRIHKEGEDVVYEIEAITNRVDTACAFGIAREGNAVLNQMAIPCELIGNPYEQKIDLYSHLPENFRITIENQSLSPRFCAVSLKNVKIAPSEKAVSQFLNLCGERPINNAVDITNELTLLYGQPIHIFDLDKIEGKTLHLRESRKGEIITLLDNSKNKLVGGDVVIEDSRECLIDLCGIMGGKPAQVDENTKNILLITATYNPQKVRRTSLYLQKRTLAAQIFEKRPDIELCLPILSIATELFSKRCMASPSSRAFDFYPDKLPPKTIDLDLVWLDKLAGVQIERESVLDILSDLGFNGAFNGENILSCTVPSWRYHDITIREDLVEEVVRIYGYYKLPPILPCVNLKAEESNKLLLTELKTKRHLSGFGYTEVFNNSLVSGDLIEKTMLNIKDHLKLTNALSQDFEYLRTSLLPSLLTNLKNNIGKTDLPINIFELSNVYIKQAGAVLPEEQSSLSLLTSYDFLYLKGTLEALFTKLNTDLIAFMPLKAQSTLFLKEKSSQIMHQDKIIGFIGELNKNILHNLDLKVTPVVAVINLPLLISTIRPGYSYTPISPYPPLIEEITIESETQVGSLIQFIKEIDPLITQVQYLNSFRNKHSFRVVFTSHSGNLDQKTVDKIKEKILKV